jgi:dipeptidyl-peptidase-4
MLIMTESFPRQEARTRRFTLGVPRAFCISPDGARVAYLRTKGGDDPVTCLWVLDVGSGTERLVSDPRALGGDERDLPPEERARRERVREQAGGIVAYATDADLTVAVFGWSGRVFAVGLTHADAAAHELAVPGPVLDPRPDPAGKRLAYVRAGALRVASLADPADDQVLAEAAGVTFGLAEFIAAEEMGRTRGYWWSPDGSALLAARVDEAPVNRWHIADPANPDRAPAEVAYPAAGTPNAEVSLLLARLDGSTAEIDTDRAAFPYLVTACWAGEHDPLVLVQSRDQRRMRLLSVDAGTGRAEVLHEDTDPRWLEVVPGVPAWTGDGRLVWTADREDTRRLLIGTPGALAAAEPVTPPGLQVRGVIDVDGDTVLFQASGEPAEIGLWAYSPDGLHRVGPEGGVEVGTRAGGTTVVARRGLDQDGVTVRVYRDAHPPPRPPTFVASISSLAEKPALPEPRPVLFGAGPREVRTAVLFPSRHEPGQRKLPVLLDPYGGPHAQRVLAARSAYLTAQWFAEQGFAVVIADGRGTPGRGARWERAVAGDLAGPVLEDQVDALREAAARFPDLDMERVAIRGWSFGGYLAALAVLRRPDVFGAAIAGAPVTDWRLYDTHYTERYLGDPVQDPGPYDRCSLINSAERAGDPRPLMLIHGLADDNVVVAHTLRLSSALLAAGYPHRVLPLSGITHMASQAAVAENLLLLQLDFLRSALGLAAS